MTNFSAVDLAGNLTKLGCLLWAGGVILLLFAGCGLLLLGGQ